MNVFVAIGDGGKGAFSGKKRACTRHGVAGVMGPGGNTTFSRMVSLAVMPAGPSDGRMGLGGNKTVVRAVALSKDSSVAARRTHANTFAKVKAGRSCWRTPGASTGA